MSHRMARLVKRSGKVLYPCPMLLTAELLTFNSQKWALRCLETLVNQEELTEWQIVCLDNASEDRAYIEELKQKFPQIKFLQSEENLGFSRGHNRIMNEFPADYHAVLNIDVLFAPDFLAKLIKALEDNPHFGSSTGKLLQWHPDVHPEKTNIIDSAGIHMTSAHAFADRGQGQEDTSFTPNAYDSPDVCFGGTGAATIYRRSALEEVAENNQFFDERMFMYKEDIDLAYRLMTKGHFCIFVPDAIAWHARSTNKSRNNRSVQERIYSAAHESLILKKHKYQWSLKTKLLTNMRQLLKWTYLLIFEPKVFFKARKLLATASWNL